MNSFEFFSKINKKQWLFVFLIALLGFAIRGHLMRYEFFFEFDSYLHARILGYILQTGAVPAIDPIAYYFSEVGFPLTPVFWYFSALIYKIMFLGAGYSKDLVIIAVKFLPAFYGALVSAAMFFLGKEIYDKRAGYAMAFVAAVSPAFIYRTMAGFFEDDSLGFLWLVLGFVFMVRALKSTEINREMIINTVLAGLFFAIMAWSWGMFLLIPLTIIPFFIFAFAKVIWLKNKKELTAFAAAFIGLFIIFAISASLLMNWVNLAIIYVEQALGMLLIPAIVIAIALTCLLLYLAFFAKESKEKTERFANFTAIGLMLVMFLMLLVTMGIFLSVDQIFAKEGILGASVGEENTGHQFFGGKYNALIVLPILALILLPIRIWNKRNDHFSLLLFFWILITFVMAWYKLKFTFVFGLSLAPAAGVVAAEFFRYTKERSKLEQKIVFAGFAFLLLTGLAAGITFTKTNIPNIEFTMPNWKPALEWMRTETPEDAKMFNWWDEGHWITFMGERAVLNDNRNMFKESDQDFALFTITADVQEAIMLVDRYDSDYVVLSNDFFYKMISFGQYAYDTTSIDDPRIVPFRYGLCFSQGCSRDAQGTVNCGGNVFSSEVWQSIPTTWDPNPEQFYEERDPLFIYRDKDVPVLYVFNEAANNSFSAKLWFNEPGAMQYFEESYASQGVKVFKAKKEAIKLALNS